jgi:6-phosphogluconolactonase/glucosamine-6-phosphate isomerase/deaminase
MGKVGDFVFEPASWIPFRDRKEIERVRAIKRGDITKHWNPNYKIRVVPDEDIVWLFIGDMVARLKEADEQNKRVIFIMPNPCHAYHFAAMLINRMRINCRNLRIFAMDEWADQDGNIAPETWPCGFGHALLKHFYSNIDESLRPPRAQVTLFTNENVKDYSKMLVDMGGADACYCGPGWAGHVAFIDPNVPEWSKDLAEWKKQGARVCTLHPLTIAQNSLHGYFGMSGDLTAVPPKAASIGPADVIGSKYRMDIHSLTTRGTFSTWQRMTSRLVVHGPVTPQLPTSLLQELATDVIFSESCAADVEPRWNMEY